MGETGERGEIGEMEDMTRSECLARHGMHMEILDQLKWGGKGPGLQTWTLAFCKDKGNMSRREQPRAYK